MYSVFSMKKGSHKKVVVSGRFQAQKNVRATFLINTCVERSKKSLLSKLQDDGLNKSDQLA